MGSQNSSLLKSGIVFIHREGDTAGPGFDNIHRYFGLGDATPRKFLLEQHQFVEVFQGKPPQFVRYESELHAIPVGISPYPRGGTVPLAVQRPDGEEWWLIELQPLFLTQEPHSSLTSQRDIRKAAEGEVRAVFGNQTIKAVYCTGPTAKHRQGFFFVPDTMGMVACPLQVVAKAVLDYFPPNPEGYKSGYDFERSSIVLAGSNTNWSVSLNVAWWSVCVHAKTTASNAEIAAFRRTQNILVGDTAASAPMPPANYESVAKALMRLATHLIKHTRVYVHIPDSELGSIISQYTGVDIPDSELGSIISQYTGVDTSRVSHFFNPDKHQEPTTIALDPWSPDMQKWRVASAS